MKRTLLVSIVLLSATSAWAGVGDPQTKTDHPWYPGELSCSTWERLFQTQNDLYTRVTGRKTDNDEDKVLAAWYWRNLNVHHTTVAAEDLTDTGFAKAEQDRRDFWTGQFADGFGICFTTHHQLCAEMEKLLGPGRSRICGIGGHTSHEVWLTGGAYGTGKWALLDHDISTLIFSPDGGRLLSLSEVAGSKYRPAAQSTDASRGWLPNSLHSSDSIFSDSKFVGYSTGYAGIPPMVYLRAGESLRRYVRPGEADGKTFAYWGINYNAGGIPGPHRNQTWVGQPEKMYKTGKRADGGHGRYGNAVYVYEPDFTSARYKEGVIDEGDDHVTFEWYSPYVIAANPAEAVARKNFGIYEPGCTGGLVISGKISCPVEVSTDQGKSWVKADGKDGLDLTDTVKGHRQYLLKFGAGAKALAGTGLKITTVCQCGQTIVPHVKAGENHVTYEAGGKAFIAAGPNTDQAKAHLVAGAMNSPTVTLSLAAPRGAKAVRVYGAARAACSAPPKPSKYNIDYSADGGKTWKSVVKDWEVIQRKPEPNDWWSQTFCWGDAAVPEVAGPVQLRFTNTGGRNFMRAQAELAYTVQNTSPLKVTYAWKEAGAVKTATHTYAPSAPGKPDATWTFTAGARPETFYVEYAAE